jgi:hypothetical protein
VQADTDVQETPLRVLDVALLGEGIDWTVQDVPFQVSTSAAIASAPVV